LCLIVNTNSNTNSTHPQEAGCLMEVNTERAETLRALRQLCRGAAHRPAQDLEGRRRLSTGIPGLDELLPDRGLEPGWLVEWLSPVEGCGTALLALQGIRSALERRPVWAIVDSTGEFHPPAAQGWGVSLESVLWLRPSSVADVAWTVEQCLRCPAVGVTWFQVDPLPDRVLQRWKIAVEAGGGVGALFRPARAARNASWADVRWLVQPQPSLIAGERRIRVELLSCRSAFRTGDSIELDVCDATGDVRLVSAVARATSAVRAAGA
jgi:protein ImuA